MLGLRERKKAKTKAAIQQHALKLFRERGYAETTIEQIAAAAEVSPSTFFRYYPTKEDVVLTEFMDSETFRLMVEAPADLSPLQAVAYAIGQTFGNMPDEELQLEFTRNELIQSVPELRRGMLAEITRPIELLTEAIAIRLDRPLDDPDLRLYAGAAIGGLMMLTRRTAEMGIPEMMRSLRDGIERLERMLTLGPV
ncbi:TetR family transcriptional regulator [Antricoccus suffuscus]|uniref:TetR family transcriptional regulator n=1 Tax=Antricoccus suffuscus TaxID=1629062 RepID=A0A2T1A3L2_9ACTN|nr:TetR family transcriptional regulator [Antricoccus suffuscus]